MQCDREAKRRRLTRVVRVLRKKSGQCLPTGIDLARRLLRARDNPVAALRRTLEVAHESQSNGQRAASRMARNG